MKKKSLISICVVSVFLLSGLAFAGFEPMPFIGQLGAVGNIVNSALDRVESVMGVDPNPFIPTANVIGAVNRLEAMNNQLVAADDMVRSIKEEVMGIDPEPFLGDLVPALERVKEAADGIAERISNYVPPDPCVPPEPCTPFVEALLNVQSSAQEISGTAEGFIIEIEGGGSDCDIDCSTLSFDACEDNSCCLWNCEDAPAPVDCPVLGTCYNLPPEE